MQPEYKFAEFAENIGHGIREVNMPNLATDVISYEIKLSRFSKKGKKIRHKVCNKIPQNLHLRWIADRLASVCLVAYAHGFVVVDFVMVSWAVLGGFYSYPVPKFPLRPRQDGGHFPDDIFKCIFSNENPWISIKISLRFVPKGPINNVPALIQIMSWRRPGDKPLSEPMVVKLRTHICVTWPQWVKTIHIGVVS